MSLAPNYRWYLKRGPLGGVFLVVEEREGACRGYTTGVLSRSEARVALHQLTRIFERALAGVHRDPKRFDPVIINAN